MAAYEPSSRTRKVLINWPGRAGDVRTSLKCAPCQKVNRIKPETDWRENSGILRDNHICGGGGDIGDIGCTAGIVNGLYCPYYALCTVCNCVYYSVIVSYILYMFTCNVHVHREDNNTGKNAEKNRKLNDVILVKHFRLKPQELFQRYCTLQMYYIQCKITCTQDFRHLRAIEYHLHGISVLSTEILYYN